MTHNHDVVLLRNVPHRIHPNNKGRHQHSPHSMMHSKSSLAFNLMGRPDYIGKIQSATPCLSVATADSLLHCLNTLVKPTVPLIGKAVIVLDDVPASKGKVLSHAHKRFNIS